MLLTNKQKFNKKYKFPLDKPHSKDDISKITGINRKLLDTIWDRGYNDYALAEINKKKIPRGAYAMAYVYNYAYLNGRRLK